MNRHYTKPIISLLVGMLLSLVISTEGLAQRLSVRAVDTDHLMQVNGVEVIYISPTMLEMVPKASLRIDGNKSLDGIIKSVSAMHIFSATAPKAISEIKRSFAPILELRNKSFEQLMYIKNSEGTTNLIGQMNGDKAKELYLFISGENEYTIIVFTGTFTRQQIERALEEERK